jgi:DNA-binding NtrC family response regulator
LSDDAIAALQSRPWHGNVRELRNVIEHTVVVLDSKSKRVDANVLPFLEHDSPVDGSAPRSGGFPLGLGYHAARDHVLADFEKDYLRHIVRRANGNLSDAARFAGVDRTTLYRLMDKHDLRKEDLMRTDTG